MAAKSAYEATALEIRELFSDYLENGFSENDGDRPAVALGNRPPSATARNAIVKSLEAFGYGTDACTFISLTPVD